MYVAIIQFFKNSTTKNRSKAVFLTINFACVAGYCNHQKQ